MERKQEGSGTGAENRGQGSFRPQATDEAAALDIEGRGQLPGWQSAFVLGPNVRFTRTPDAAIKGRNPPEDASRAAAVGPQKNDDLPRPQASVNVSQAALANPAPEPLVSAGLTKEPPLAKPAYLPQPADAVGARALTYRLRRELARAEEQAGLKPEGSPPEARQAPGATVPDLVQAVVDRSRLTDMEPTISRPMVPPRVPPRVSHAWLQPSGQSAPGALTPAAPVCPQPFATPAASPARQGLKPLSPIGSVIPGELLSADAFFEALSMTWGADDADPVMMSTGQHALPAPKLANEPILGRAVTASDAPVAPSTQDRTVSPPPALDRSLPAEQAVRPEVIRLRHPETPDVSVVALYRQVEARAVQAAVAAPSGEAARHPGSAAAQALPQQAGPIPSTAAATVAPAPAPLPQPQANRRLRPSGGLEFNAIEPGEYEYPPLSLLQEARIRQATVMTPEALEQSAGLLESVLEDFGIKGEIIDVRPGPVVTLYEFEPAPGVKSSRVIGLSDDIARSMSALSARVAVVPGRNVIGIELPNPVRETVYLRELIETGDYAETRFKLPLCLGKTIGGEPVIAELAKMPHLLVAGTTGSGKSVAINTMILSLLYRLKPEECRLIMVDPKMLELSVYDGIPHLLTPVVTDPKKAVMALKWAVREMEDRYRKMSRLGVRNIDGYNARAAAARAKGETIMASVQTGFDRSSGEAIFEEEEMDLAAMPYIVVIVDEMADLMMVAGKEIEGAIQRLAQMARAAGIHLIMATQRPSVDVITGTIKANFPTRISFQVTSKIDSRTILGEPGAEHLLGQGDMLHMVGGGRIARVHGPFVADDEVEKVVAHLKMQGRPDYLGTVTEDADEVDDEAEEDSAVFDKSAMGEEDASDLYDKAVKIVLRDRKCSTSYIQRRLSIGYNKAASLVERMEQEGLVGPANHVGKRNILRGRDGVEMPVADNDD
ncbi:DNA translocase FtsK (plasmid) [Peteryoungia desertarenae]|uniref:DNA translocase FtsK n=1 Tax=Peteryoungia desertarenae TaxID=1813451 RepID=A0ABX6QUT9_9HYPH|nr:DNA translocase FtsK [Peteryoungia desertarenae]